MNGIYAPKFDDKCLICGQNIANEDYTIALKLDPDWDRKEKFDLEKHATDELKGYKHQRCSEIIQIQDSRRTFINTLCELAERDESICLLVPDVGFNYIDGFEQKFPNRYFNLGVTEFSSMIIAASMALSGLKPVIYSMIPFMTFRSHEQVRNAICLHKANVKIAGVLGGPSYHMLGLSHNLLYSTEDIDMMKTLPNMEIYLPSNNDEVRSAVLAAFSHSKPSYIKL